MYEISVSCRCGFPSLLNAPDAESALEAELPFSSWSTLWCESAVMSAHAACECECEVTPFLLATHRLSLYGRDRGDISALCADERASVYRIVSVR